jgi:Lipid A 3-O-deacylase (PagL)
MTPQFKPAAYKNVQSERDLVSACPRLSGRVLTLRERDRKRRFVKGAPALAAAIVIALFLTTSAIAQERQHAYSEYTYWFDGAFENAHAFSSTVGARNYELESRYERLIYWKEPFAVRWVLEVVPVALVGDPHTHNGHRAYAYGVGGSPIGAQVNFVHFHHISNVNLGNQNPGLDSHMLFVGLSLFR